MELGRGRRAATSSPDANTPERWPMSRKSESDAWIWGLALGYFAFYIPYSALTKALSNGELPGMQGRVSGFELLPATVITTALAMPVIITLLGWWKHVDSRRVLGLWIPVPSAGSAVSGLAFAVIIATTTLAYTFEGISIVFALLLMRGGVLILAPVIDTLSRRRLRASSWGALALSFLALAIALADVGSYQLSVAAVINLALYLAGYFFRLRLITRAGKSEFEHSSYRYFVEEQMVAMPVLLGVPALLALIGGEGIPGEIRRGFTTFLFSEAAGFALMIGVLYAALGTFGTLIYLNRRENSFSVPVNRSASLLSGVAAAFLLSLVAGQAAPRPSQLASAAIIIAAVFLLGSRTRASARGRDRIVLFVCDGNRARSPIAEAICNSEIGGMVVGSLPPGASLRAVSAGLEMKLGSPMKPEAKAALRALGIEPGAHAAKAVSEDMVRRAELVFCFTAAQRAGLVERYPWAAARILLLDPSGDIREPRAGDADDFAAVAGIVRERVRTALADPVLLGTAEAVP
jgi:protein-tyrosine-phosphatase